MRGFLDNFLSKEDQRKLSNFSQKAKKELSSLPVISAIGDTVQGASGLGELQKKLEKEPNNPKSWLYYYEGHMAYKKLNSGVNVGRGVLNPVGFIVGKGIATGLNTVDQEYESFDPRKCLGMAIALSMKTIKNPTKNVDNEDFVILAKALAYSAASAKTLKKRDEMLTYSIDYASRAIRSETDKGKQAEYFFYLSQFYNQAGNEKMKLRSLNLSRKLGFLPADKLLKSLVKKKLEDINEKQLIDQTTSPTPYQSFLLTYHPKTEVRLENTFNHVVETQQQKFSETGKRLGKLFDKYL